jgi:hypothetical protein
MSWRSVLLVFSTNKTDRHDITEILFFLSAVISISQQNLKQSYFCPIVSVEESQNIIPAMICPY